ncbi:hypothetical protein [Burkholderia metallica]|uniref:hypothetical protein n=1 Tax=Burkholderia metallica TaxID=488729 RepID=UPI0020C607E8|nr:hypothetical protein [Burkholderia metallica]
MSLPEGMATRSGLKRTDPAPALPPGPGAPTCDGCSPAASSGIAEQANNTIAHDQHVTGIGGQAHRLSARSAHSIEFAPDTRT